MIYVNTRQNIISYLHSAPKYRLTFIYFRDEEEQSLADFCSAVAGVNSQFSAVVDLTWNGWDDVATKCRVGL